MDFRRLVLECSARTANGALAEDTLMQEEKYIGMSIKMSIQTFVYKDILPSSENK